MPTPYWPIAGSVMPSLPQARRRNASGSWIRMPAPSPCSGSAPVAPRCVRFSRISQALRDDRVALAALDVRDEARARRRRARWPGRTGPARPGGQAPGASVILAHGYLVQGRIVAAANVARQVLKQARCLLGRYNGETFSCYSRCCIATRQAAAEPATRVQQPVGDMRRSPDCLAQRAVLGFNLNKFRYLLVATLNRADGLPVFQDNIIQDPTVMLARPPDRMAPTGPDAPRWLGRHARAHRLRRRQRRAQQPVQPARRRPGAVHVVPAATHRLRRHAADDQDRRRHCRPTRRSRATRPPCRCRRTSAAIRWRCSRTPSPRHRRPVAITIRDAVRPDGDRRRHRPARAAVPPASITTVRTRALRRRRLLGATAA